MANAAAKITRKGQVTIPKNIREKLHANAVYFEIVDDTVVVRLVKSAAGSFSEYAGNAKPGASMEKMRDRAWEVAVREKAGKKSS